MTTEKIKDFQLTYPTTLREFVLDEIQEIDARRMQKGKPVEPTTEDDIADLMKSLFAYIEKQALEVHRSNEPWALKQWAYENILKETASEALDPTVSSLIEPIRDWQKKEFDPIANFKLKLKVQGRKPGTISEYMRVANLLVAKYGRKKKYTESELLEFLAFLRDKYPDKRKPNGDIIPSCKYAHMVQMLKTLLDSLPEDDNGRKVKLPLERLPEMPREFEQPLFESREIDAMMYAAIMDEAPDRVLRFAIASIYGTRVSELAMLSSESINLDHGNPTISIPTLKKGRRLPQPIPMELLPLFSIPFETKKSYNIERDLKRLVRKAGIQIKPRMGIHSVRRSVVTALYNDTDLKELSIRRFMRWSEGGHGMGVMPRYVRTSTAVTDSEVLERHPFARMWKEYIPFLEYIPKFQSYLQIATFAASR